MGTVRTRRRVRLASVEAALVLAAVGGIGVAGLAGYFIGRASADGGSTEAASTEAQPETETTPATTAETESAPATTGETGSGGGDAAAGAEVFASAGCGSCHTLTAAGSTGAVGPNLDTITLDEAGILDVVTNGRNAMPSFAGQLDEQQLADVAAYVAESKTG